MVRVLRRSAAVIGMAAVLVSAPARANEASDYARYGECARAAAPCEILACIERFGNALSSAHADELARTRDLSSRACALQREEQTLAVFARCLASSGPCACGDIPRGEAHTPDMLRVLAEARLACQAGAAAPTAEQAARAFLNRFYLAVGAGVETDKEAIAALYVRNPVIEGATTTGDDAATRRIEARSRDLLRYVVRQDTVEIACQPHGPGCEVKGLLEARHAIPGEPAAVPYELRRFDLLVVDVRSSPRVASEKEHVTAPEDSVGLPMGSLPTGSVALPPAGAHGGPETPTQATREAPASPSTLPLAEAAPEAGRTDANPQPPVRPRTTSSAGADRAAAPAPDGGSSPPPLDEVGRGASAPQSGVAVAPPEPAPAEDAKLRPCERRDALETSGVVVVNAPEGGLHIGLESYNKTLALKPKQVVLTFDDGPNPGTTESVLEALKAECVQATFFLIGRNAQAHPELVRREVREGHTIGYHTWSHPARTLAGIPKDDAIEEIERGFAAVDKAGYDRVARDGMPKTPWFRFPGFADTKETLEWLDKRRITVFGADFWAADWITMSPEAELSLVMKHLHEKGGGIVLLHDARAQTAKMLPAFLRTLKDEGYQVVHIEPGDPSQTPLRDAGPGWKSETEEIVAKVMPRLLKLPPYTPDGGVGPAPE